MLPTSTTSRWYSPDAVSSGTETQKQAVFRPANLFFLNLQHIVSAEAEPWRFRTTSRYAVRGCTI